MFHKMIHVASIISLNWLGRLFRLRVAVGWVYQISKLVTALCFNIDDLPVLRDFSATALAFNPSAFIFTSSFVGTLPKQQHFFLSMNCSLPQIESTSEQYFSCMRISPAE
jgi:hypothetical protein